MTYMLRIYDSFLTLVGHVLCRCFEFSKLKFHSVVPKQIMLSLFLSWYQFKIYNTDITFFFKKKLNYWKYFEIYCYRARLKLCRQCPAAV